MRAGTFDYVVSHPDICHRSLLAGQVIPSGSGGGHAVRGVEIHGSPREGDERFCERKEKRRASHFSIKLCILITIKKKVFPYSL